MARGLLAPGLLGYFWHAPKVPKNALQTVIEKLSPLVALAEKNNVTLLLESGGAMADTKKLVDVLDYFACDHLAACWNAHRDGQVLRRQLPPGRRGQLRIRGAVFSSQQRVFYAVDLQVPSAARQSALPIELCAEVSTGIGLMHRR